MSQDSPAASLSSPVSATCHLTAAGETTWYEFTRAILDEAVQTSPGVPWFVEATQGRPLITKRVIPITATEYYPLPASRPHHSVLSNSSLIQRLASDCQTGGSNCSMFLVPSVLAKHMFIRSNAITPRKSLEPLSLLNS
jgi:hypothetical protein